MRDGRAWREDSMITREEHIEWCKKRALEYLDAGDLSQAFTSMLSDVHKHPECKNHPGLHIGTGFMMLPGWIQNREEIRRWIVGFR
jgi:hypothetical protein